MYSDTFLDDVGSTYENEMMDVARSGSYMGIWQFFRQQMSFCVPFDQFIPQTVTQI